MTQETEVHFQVGTLILGFLSIFKKSQASSPYEALNSFCLSRGLRDVRNPVQMRLGHRAFSRDCNEDSDILLSCEMKDEPAFKPLQGNPTFLQVRESRYPLHLMQKIQCPSHIPIAEGRFLLRCLWKVTYLFNRILGISSLLKKIWGAWSFPRVPVLKLVFL